MLSHDGAGILGKFFYRSDVKCNSTQYRNYCKESVDAYERLCPIDASGMSALEKATAAKDLRTQAFESLNGGILGQKPAQLAHILGGQDSSPCKHCTDDARASATAADDRKKTGTAHKKSGVTVRKRPGEDSDGQRPAKRTATNETHGTLDPWVFKGIEMPFSNSEKEIIEAQAERAVISCNLPEDIFTQPEMVQLFTLFRARAADVLPSAKLIGGRLLDDAIDAVDIKVRKKLTGRFVGIQTDGWRRFRVGLTGVCSNDRGSIRTLEIKNTTAARKDGEAMALFFAETVERVEEKFRCIVTHFVTDADGGSRKGRVIYAIRRPDLFTPSCFAHQGQLCLGDYLKVSALAKEISEDAISAICWINNHDKVRLIFDESQRQISPDVNDGKVIVLAYIVANLTRWTTHGTALLRLLRLERPIVAAIRTGRNAIIKAQVGAAKSTEAARLRKEATTMCDLLEDRSNRFWGPLKDVVGDLEPICLATNINQQDAIRPDQVLLAFAGIYLHFAEHPDADVQEGMIKRIEKRWKDADQGLMILGVILNPFEMLTPFGPDAGLSRLKLRKLFMQEFSRLQSSPHNLDDAKTKEEKLEAAVTEFLAFLASTGEWGEFRMDMEDWVRRYGKCPFKIYEFMTGSSVGMTEFCTFAMVILSVVMNTAGAERLFSNLKIRLADRRARTKIEKLEKKARVGEQIRHEHVERGLIKSNPSRKRQNHASESKLLVVPRYSDLLGDQDAEDEDERGMELVRGAAGWRTELARWIGNARAAENDEDTLPTPEEVSAEARAAAAAKWQKITLAKLFKGATPPPRLSQDELDAQAEVDYFNDLANADEDEYPDDGAIEGYDENDDDYAE